jgi:hypothetical protein
MIVAFVAGEMLLQLRLTQRRDLSADRSSKFQTSTSREALNFNIQNMYRAILLEVGYWNFFGAWMLELGPLAVRQRVRRQLGERLCGRNEAPDQILDGDDAT